MIIQKTNNLSSGVLYLVSTPIGNFKDMTYRAIEVLNEVDTIFAEDTRMTKQLLSHFKISTSLKAYHIFNESEQVNVILDMLKDGKKLALVSDAGMPGISDPGYLVARLALDNGYAVISLPGANAALTALIASGIPSDKFFFFGFLNHKQSQKEKELIKIRDYEETLIFYEAPHRIKETLEVIYKVFGNREICLAREITKKYEEYIRGEVLDIINSDLELKGEIVLIVSGAKVSKIVENLNELSILEHYNHYLEIIEDKKEAMKLVAKDRAISKSDVYKEILK
jgi:16S rRNA (cytidine1402-2'-O)-methyltransferase